METYLYFPLFPCHFPPQSLLYLSAELDVSHLAISSLQHSAFCSSLFKGQSTAFWLADLPKCQSDSHWPSLWPWGPSVITDANTSHCQVILENVSRKIFGFGHLINTCHFTGRISNHLQTNDAGTTRRHFAKTFKHLVDQSQFKSVNTGVLLNNYGHDPVTFDNQCPHTFSLHSKEYALTKLYPLHILLHDSLMNRKLDKQHLFETLWMHLLTLLMNVIAE